MADYKDYIVRYDIIADVTKAAEGLQSIANIAKQFEGPMNTLKTAITQVSQSVYQLKQNSQMTFAPKIDVGAFNNQLRAMVTQVRSAAAEMHAAIFEALSGNAAATKAAQKGIGSTLGGTRSVAAIKKDIEAYNKELDKLLGTPKKNKKGDTVRNRDGAIQMTKNALAKGSAQVQQQMQERLLKLESQKRMFQNLIQQRKAELAVAEKLEKEAAAQQAKAAKAQSKATAAPASKPTSSPQPAKLTNVTPAVIREWKKAFGDAKSKALTVNIRGNATGAGGALTVIEQIQASLRALQSQGTFNINPILNTEGFAAAEAKLRQLAGLSAAVVAPFTSKDTKAKTGTSSSLVSTLTKDEKIKLTNAQKQIKTWNEKIAPIQSRLNANRAIPEDQRTPAIKGQITRDTKTLAQYQANKAEQENIVRSLQGKSTAAVQTAAKAAKPFALDIVGNLSKINVTAKPPVVQVVGEISKLQGKVTEVIPVNVKIMADQVAASVKSIPAPTLDVRVHLLTDGIQQQIQSLAGQSKPVVKTASKAAPASAVPATQAHPVYTPPVFTAADEKQLNNLTAKYGALSTAQEKAAKAMASAKAKLDKSGGSNRAFDRYMAAQREYGGIKKEYLDVQKQLKSLMSKQLQSTAQRALTDEEIAKGIGAQKIVNQLAAKKRLSAAQKTQLAEANQTLTALRAPATPPATPAPTVAVSQPTTTTQPPKAKKATGKNVITATVDTKNIISQIQSIPKQTIPVSIKLMWEKGAVGRQEQIKRLAGNIPPITLNVDTTGAIAKLEEFIAKVRAASPQNIKLTATGAVTNTAPATTVPPTQKTPAAAPASAKAKAPTGVGQKKPVVTDPTKSPAQTKPQSVALRLDTTAAVAALEEFIAKVRAASPQNIKLTATGAVTNTAPATTMSPQSQTTKANKITGKNIIAATVDTKNIVNQIQSIPKQTISVAVKLMWEKGAIGRQEQLKRLTSNIPPVSLRLDTTMAITQLEEFIAKVKASSLQNIKLTATGTAATPAQVTPTIPPQKSGVTAQATKKPTPTTTSPKTNGVTASTKGLAETKSPVIALKLDTSSAVVTLEEFIAKIKAASPQNIRLTATGAGNGTPTPPAQPITAKKNPITPSPEKVATSAAVKNTKQPATSKAPTVSLTLDTTGAIAAFEEFIAKIRAASPQNIKLTASGTTTPYASKPSATDNSKIVKATPLTPLPKRTSMGNVQTPRLPDNSKIIQKPVSSVTLTLDTSSAIASLEGFISKIKAASPQNIKLTATGTPTNAPQTAVAPTQPVTAPVAPVVPPATGGSTQKGTKQAGHTGHQPLTGREKYDKLKTQSEDRARKQLADNKFRAAKHQEYNTQQQNWYNQQQALYNKLFGAASKPDPNWAYRQEQQRAAELAKMQEDARAAYAKPTPFEQKEAAAHQAAVAQSIAKHQRQADALRAKAQNAMLPFAQSKGQLDLLTKYRKFFKDAIKTTGISPRVGMSVPEELRYLQGVSSLMQKANVAVPWQLQDQINQHNENIAKQEASARAASQAQSIAQKQQRANALRTQARNAILPWVSNESQLNAVLKNRRYFRDAIALTGINPMSANTTSAQRLQYFNGVADWMRANNAPIPWQLQDQIQKLTAQQLKNAESAAKVQQKADATARHEESRRSIARHQQQAERLRAQAQNAMLPFAQNKEQLNMLTKHRRFFRQAVTSTGIMPTPGMEAPQMLKYLQGVSTQMQQASVAVPWQLQSQINKLEGDVAKSKGIGESTATRRSAMAPMPMRQKPFFDRTRRWAYPFTGQTSFGVRTPMAVDMAKGMGVMFAIGGAMSAIGSSFSQAMEYQNTMRTTQAILQNGTDSYSQNSFKNMEETVRNVGIKTKFSAPEVANAARFLAMAGYDIDAINAAIRPIADLALIGDSDLGETADKMTNIMTTFQIAPERMREAANIMATTATRSNTDLMMLAESAKYGGGVANMYGRNDPNLFADTMALFGVMGNAGIQASSAGTALRMMYQNLFKPNKNQKAVLDMMKQTYGITTIKDDGSYRSMSDILIEMAQRIPENQMAQIVGNLFRITAQPGAAATLLAAAGGDKGIAQEIGTGIEAMSSKMSSKAGLSSLVSLMLANRNSANGNISGAIAEEKQNTISGLWAQVTSTFTEGIVQAFENRQGGFEDMLRKLRDYLAKPETIQMMQNLLDLIIEIGKVMASFVKIWASLYNAAPGLIKFWITFQMAITQMGTLIAPVVALIGVFDRLKGAIMALAGVSAVGGSTVTRNVAGRVVAGGAASTVLANTPFIVGSGKFGTNKVIRGNIATRAHNAMAANAILAGELALSGANKQSTLATLNKETRQHYAAVRERAMRMYGPARAGRAFRAAATAVPTVASFAPMFGGLKSMLMGLLTGLAKAAGFLVNPVTLAVGAVAGLGYGLYKLKQRIDGTSEAQQRARAQANKAADQTHRELTKEGQWYKDMMSENIPEAAPVISSVDTTQIEKYNADKQKFNQLYATIFNDFSKDASKQSINDVTTKWRNVITANPAYSLAIGNARNYDFSKKHRQMEYNPYDDASNLGVALWNMWHADEDTAINQRNGMVQDALMIEGANDLRTQQAIREIAELRQKFLAGETTYKSESEYQQAAFAIRDRFMSQFTTKLPSAGMTPEQFQQTSNRSVYDQYQLGAQNLLDATINGQMGTLVGKMNAYQWLSDAENRAKLYTDEWYNAIANIIGDYHVIYNAVSADGQQQANIELMLSTLPNGQLNFTNILDQIRAKVTNFNLTVQGFSDIIGTAYKMMAEAGIIDINDVNSLRDQIRHQLTGAKYGDETPRQYYAQWIANNQNSEWVKAGITEKQYVDFIMGRSGETLNLGNRVVSRSQEQQMMYHNISKKTANTIIQQNKHLTEKANQLGSAANANKPATTTTPTPPRASTSDQQAYASAYNRAAARPTQVVFNINSLASFDRTTVASSAEERDLMAAMEEKIAGAVYQMFAEASNQAQRVMDLT